MAPEHDKDADAPSLPGGADEYVRHSIQANPSPTATSASSSSPPRTTGAASRTTYSPSRGTSARCIDQLKKESAMNAEGIRRCVEEKEAMATACNQLSAHSTKLEKECTLYERDLERAMESCDELARENEEIRGRLNDNADTIHIDLDSFSQSDSAPCFAT